MSESQSENPLLKALPPQTDYLSYLTILEYNINKEQLPTLHQILQDTSLTTNIGWDLVHLLLPLLPHSKSCLQDVARLGNPREVVLKVTELLEKLGNETEEAEDVDFEGSDEDADVDEDKENNDQAQNDTRVDAPSNEAQLCALLDMLHMLLPRIKTEFPSRFLSTSLQAILPAYAKIATGYESTEAVTSFIKALSGTSRPKLPPRASSTLEPTRLDKDEQAAPDPEANDGSIGSEEECLQKRLLQAFLTFVVEAYMTDLPLVEDVPGMAWSCRIQEHTRPQTVIPGRRTFIELFDSSQGYLHSRDAIIGQFLQLSRDLSLSSTDLLAALTTPPSPPSSPIDLPSTASEVPLSQPGSLYLLTASGASPILFNAPELVPSISLFPQYAIIINLFIGASVPASAGTEPLALIDAVLALYDCLDDRSPSTSSPNEDFKELLQRLSLLSANTPNAALRYRAHQITKNVLHSHPDSGVRQAYIKDTLENCPYENLKASAVGWLKDEILSASTRIPKAGEPTNAFSTPTALMALTPSLFPDPSFQSLKGGDGDGDYTPFLAHQGFFLAVLNLMYLILSSQTLNVGSWDLYQALEDWLGRLERVADEVRSIAEEGRGEGGEAIEGLVVDLGLLEGNVAMVREALGKVKAVDDLESGS